MPDPRIPALLITGATGAGKTTLVSRLLSRRPADERWAVLLNDFGNATLDRAASPSVVVREVAGCICCTAHVALRTALVALLREARPQRVVIEASAAARPAALAKVLSEPGLAKALELQRTVCVVDPRQLADARYASNEAYREQIVAADEIALVGDDAERDAARSVIETLRSTPTHYLHFKGQNGFWPSPE